MKKQLILFSMFVLAGCSTVLNQPGKINSPQISTPLVNIISTDVEEGKNDDNYVSIFYLVSGLTPEGGEEITAYLKKDNNKIKILKLTLVHRINTTIELIELNDTKKIGEILNSLQSLKVSDNNDKNNINMIIGLLKEIQ